MKQAKATIVKKSNQSRHNRNHSAYKQSRRDRGDFMLYVSKDIADVWYAKSTDVMKRGGQPKYSQGCPMIM